MSILLDTQVLIWLAEDPGKVPDEIRRLIEENEALMSPASVWEMAIKISVGKLKLSVPLELLVENFRNNYEFKILEIRLKHIYRVQSLPLHHKDPFDRLLIAQTLIENIEIASSDEIFDSYGVKRIWKS